MLVFRNSEQRLVPAQPNVMTLKCPNGGYVYAGKDLYEQAVVLNHKYWNDIEGLTKLIGSNRHAAEVQALREAMPEPINILAGFIAILEDNVQFDGTLEELVGCIHVMSSAINFAKFISVHPDIRATVTFSDHIRREYELPWKKFTNDAIPYDLVYDVFAKDGTFANAALPTVAPAYHASAPSYSAPSSSSAPASYAKEEVTSTPSGVTAEQQEIMDGLDVQCDDPALANAMANDPALMALLLGIPETGTVEVATPDEDEEAADDSTDTSSDDDSGTDESSATASGKSELDAWGLD